MGNDNSDYSKILSLYEDFGSIRCQFCNEVPFLKNYSAPSSLHSPISKTAYGLPLAKDCAVLSGGGALTVRAGLEDLSAKRYYLKINCCLEQWEVMCNDIDIRINGREFYCSGREFIENVCQGWPSLYYAVNVDFLETGENLIEVSTRDSSKAGLLISEVSLLTLPSIKDFSQISCLKAVRAGETFTIAVYSPGKCFDPECESTGDNYRYEGYSKSALNPAVYHLKFTALNPGCSPAHVKSGAFTGILALAMPEVIEPSGDRCLVGTDSDDHRQDMSDEAERILEVFAYTGMGDFLQFRPLEGRTHLSFPDIEVWRKRVEFLTAMNIRISIADTRHHLLNFMQDMGGKSFIGSHIHEPYLFFACRWKIPL